MKTHDLFELVSSVEEGETSVVQACESIAVSFAVEYQSLMNRLLEKFNEDLGFPTENSAIADYVEEFLIAENEKETKGVSASNPPASL